MARNSVGRFGAFFLFKGSKSTSCSYGENNNFNSQSNNKTFSETTLQLMRLWLHSWLLTIQFPITIAHEFNYVVQIGLVHSFYLRTQRAPIAHLVRITTLTRKATIKHFPKLRCSWRAYGCLSWLLTIQFPIAIAHEFNYVVQIHESQDSVV